MYASCVIRFISVVFDCYHALVGYIYGGDISDVTIYICTPALDPNNLDVPCHSAIPYDKVHSLICFIQSTLCIIIKISFNYVVAIKETSRVGIDGDITLQLCVDRFRPGCAP